ncbi:50S ribosomal protein L5 [Candidatus Woesearchaeota archaeon]|nr:50S ribosomal protein L5 [Candidatus Woesearchaeota archaeon]
MNAMKRIRIEKLTLNVGAGKNPDLLKKGIKLLKNISGINPVQTFTMKRIPAWGLRPGLPIGCKLTLRGKNAQELLPRLLDAKSNVLTQSQFDNVGNVSFGIHEYIDVPGVKYDPEIGVMGFQICLTLDRPGYRVKRRRVMTRPVSKKHIITKTESMEFMKQAFNVKIGDQE